jgi:hypothetical protein
MTTGNSIEAAFIAGGPGARCAPGGEREGQSHLACIPDGERERQSRLACIPYGEREGQSHLWKRLQSMLHLPKVMYVIEKSELTHAE